MSQSYKTVALLESDPMYNDLLTVSLTNLGCEGIAAYNSAEHLLEAIHSGDIDPSLVVTELTSQDLDYFAFLRALDQKSFDGDILVISDKDSRVMDTAKAMAQSFGYPVLGVLKKPVRSSDLKWVFRERESRVLDEQKDPAQSLDCSEILKGLRQNRLKAFYQLQWDPIEQRVTGFESLARWEADKGEVLPPSAFIPSAEAAGIIDQLTVAFLHRVFADTSDFIDAYGQIHIGINFSVDTLQNLAFPDLMEELCRQYQVDPASIVVEVTESRLTSKRINLLEVLARLHLMGFTLSIDDFGTGYSSLYRIKDIPFAELKIDRSFVQSAAGDESSRAVIKSSVNLARDLNMRVVAEGVETDDQERYVTEAGCDSVQGFYRSKPLDSYTALRLNVDALARMSKRAL